MDDYWDLPDRRETPEEKAARLKRKREEDEASKRLGQKLLAGWCMLDEHCPAGCPAPLMRDKNKNKHCVMCNLVIAESQEQQQNDNTKKDVVVTDKEQIIEDEEEKEDKIGAEPERPERKFPPLYQESIIRAKEPGLSKRVTHSKEVPIKRKRERNEIYLDDEVHIQDNEAITHHTVHSLYHKMDSVRKQLEATPASHTEKCLQLIALLKECSLTIKALQQLT